MLVYSFLFLSCQHRNPGQQDRKCSNYMSANATRNPTKQMGPQMTQQNKLRFTCRPALQDCLKVPLQCLLRSECLCRFRLNIWDVGGQKTLRAYWRNYFEQTDALVWVVDCADRQRVEASTRASARLIPLSTSLLSWSFASVILQLICMTQSFCSHIYHLEQRS